MKNFIIANKSKNKRYKFENIDILLKAQIENSIELGWKTSDIILLTNFDYEFMGVKATNIKLNEKCLTGSKIFGIQHLFNNNKIDDTIWAHDLDAWQNIWFDCPEIKDAGITCYSNRKYNGGSIFWTKNAKDIINEVVNTINENQQEKEEPTLNKVLKSERYKERITVVNRTFNVGCSGYVVRWNKSIKPLRVCHFHPYNLTAWETHALDRNGLDTSGISSRLEKLLRKYYPNLTTELSNKGKEAQKQRRRNRLLSQK